MPYTEPAKFGLAWVSHKLGYALWRIGDRLMDWAEHVDIKEPKA